jgi:hypothetical protein
MRQNSPPGKSPKACPVPVSKIFCFSPEANQLPIVVVLSREEGRWPSSRTLGQDAVDAGLVVARFVRADERRGGVRRSRVVLTPQGWRQVLKKLTLLRGDGDNQA